MFENLTTKKLWNNFSYLSIEIFRYIALNSWSVFDKHENGEISAIELRY